MFDLFKKNDNEKENKKAKNSCCNFEFEEMPAELIDENEKELKEKNNQQKCCR